jgi:ABC-type glycerol-3-phosphate transport system substrate-binding protein
LNYGVAPLPQLNPSAAVVPAKYYGLAVSNKSASQSAAWRFIAFMTTDQATAESYLIASGRPPALRSLIQDYLNTPTLGVFASQALIARSWNMPPAEEVSGILNTMIQSVLSGNDIRTSLGQAETGINNLVR